MYSDWVPTIECPTITNQVVKDLKEALSISKEVLDRLNGNEEDLKIYDILNGFACYTQTEYEKDLIQKVSHQVVAAGAEMLGPILEQWLKSFLFGSRSQSVGVKFPPLVTSPFSKGGGTPVII